jgi:rhamnulokinase
MSEKCFLGIDLGAESGRVMAGLWDGRRLRLEEVRRFPNGAVSVGETLRWDIVRIIGEIERGLALAAQKFGANIVSAGADTWGVDFVLFSKSGELLGLPRHYRDARNRAAMEALLELVPRAEIFAASGVQFIPINTLCQLLALHEDNPEILEAAETFLMMPDFLHWHLCGARTGEFTNATTTQFFHPREKRWSVALLEKLGLPTKMLPEVVTPGTELGLLRESLMHRTGLGGIKIVAPATHDTASAVAAVPTAGTGRGNWAYISSGTWSLLGVELAAPNLSPRALELNLTNEGGVDGSYRLLKNIMGLWLLQCCRRAFEKRGGVADYAELVRLAGAAPAFRSLIDPDDLDFLNPPEMPAAIARFCRDTRQPAPRDEGEFTRCVLESLALKYATVVESLEDITGQWMEAIHIVGGGSRNALLNQFTANACARKVVAGPVEATVLGNVLVQARAAGELGSLDDIRRLTWSSSDVQEFQPRDGAGWKEGRARFAEMLAARASDS